MSVRVGIAVAGGAVRAVAVRDGDVLWAAESSVDGRTIEAAVTELLTARRLHRWPRPMIVAAVGPARSQLRRLSSLPPVLDAGALARLVSESTSRFFLRNGVALVTTGVRRDRDGDSEGWGAAIEQPVIVALEAACRARGWRLTAVLPTLAVIPHALQGDSLTWNDGEVCAHVTLSGGRLTNMRRTVADVATPASAHDAVPLAAPGLAALGADGWRFADAYGAAVASVRDPLAYRPARAALAAPIRKWRLVTAGVACGVALVSAILGPTLMTRHAAARATSALAALARQRRAAEAAESDLVHVSRALDEVAAFDSDRHPATLLLNDLARVLPTGGALVTLRVDSAGGTLVALAPRAAILIERMEHVAGLTTPTFVGPVTREVAGGSEVERVAIHFNWAGASARAAMRATNAGKTP
jgi:Tfp pilus assembly protein PilN